MEVDFAALFAQGVAIVVATADERLRPQIGRGWGPALEPGGVVSLCVGAPRGSQMRASLERGGLIAATFSVPTTYRTVQVKGPVAGTGEPTPEQLARVQAHVDAFGDETAAVGVPQALAPRLLERGLVAVRIEVRDVFDQTPGPRAGARL